MVEEVKELYSNPELRRLPMWHLGVLHHRHIRVEVAWSKKLVAALIHQTGSQLVTGAATLTESGSIREVRDWDARIIRYTGRIDRPTGPTAVRIGTGSRVIRSGIGTRR
jgi:hypothetical protein